MSIARHHNEWLSLLEISGPFLSMPVLLRVFPQGLDALDKAQSAEARLAYEEWLDNQSGLRPNPAIHTVWIRYVLERVLGIEKGNILDGQAIPSNLRAFIAEQGEALLPDMVISSQNPSQKDGQGTRMLVQVYSHNQNPEKVLSDKRWKASPAMRMMELLRSTGVPLGLVTNGEQWMLVYAPRGETSSFISWYAALWLEEPLTLRAFCSLLSANRFFSVSDEDTLEGMLKASVNQQQEVTDQLGYQVRRAVEVLVRSLDKADQDRGRVLLQQITESDLYEAALTVMMRLVFLFSAEERGLLLLSEPIYDENYAVSTLRAQLHETAEQQGEEVLERRFDAWCRLLATFRAVYSGIQHDRLNLPAYGGSLFDPDRFPFLEGRTALTPQRAIATTDPSPNFGRGSRGEGIEPLPISNRTVLHLLDALQVLRVKVPGGGPAEPRRLSFRSLDVEQIGHVYEGLLDHIAVRAKEPVLGLVGSKDKEPEIPLSIFKSEYAKGEDHLVAFLAEQTGRSTNALKRAMHVEGDVFESQHLQIACNNDADIYRQVLPYAGLLRQDDFGFPTVFMAGSVYVTAGATRRATGTHYTPRSLTEPIVQHTLEPLVYTGPAEGLPKEQWKLKTPAELLDLKICDMAMGSAGFLVQVIRYMSERLVEAWEETMLALTPGRADATSNPSPKKGEGSTVQVTPEGKLAQGTPGETIIPKDDEERLILARRLVADRCIYGVDKNPLAVEIAKLSIWLVTMDKGRPFTFLDHALKCGDSLVGASADDFLRWAHGWKAAEATLFDAELQKQLETAREKRRKLEGFTVRDVRDAQQKAELLKEAEAAMERVKVGCDLLAGTRLLGLKGKEVEDMQINLLFPYMAGEEAKNKEARLTLALVRQMHAFHWEFEFPEVFQKGGFSALVGNPPFLGGTRISTTYGNGYLGFLQQAFPTFQSRADLCALFYIRAYKLLSKKGNFSLIATNTIAQGDTRETGLDFITGQLGGFIYWAVVSLDWPGKAGVTVSIIGITKDGNQKMEKVLNGSKVEEISSFLEDIKQTQKPNQLTNKSFAAYTGSKLDGVGFILEKSEALSLIRVRKNTDVIFPYLNGDDTNSQPDQKASRYVINFFDWPEAKAREYNECFNLIQEKVYPQRQKHSEAKVRQNYWLYQRSRSEMYEAIKHLNRVLVLSAVSKWLGLVFVEKGQVLNVNLCVFTTDRWDYYSILQSNIHELWARQFSSTLETRLSYSISDAFETFPFFLFPLPSALESIGEKYHEYRRQIMLSRQEGLTTTYNNFHNQKEKTVEIARLRELHVEMDNAVAATYGWQDLDLGHGFHETSQGLRYTISEPARREVLRRLLELNHERYEEEVKVGLHEKKGKVGDGKKGRKVKEEKRQYGLF